MVDLMDAPRLVGLKTYVADVGRTRDFWSQHFGLTPMAQDVALRYLLGDLLWEQWPGGRFCGARGPHGALPVFRIQEFSHARGYLLAHQIPIVFEELIPGLSLLIFLDPDNNPFELAQETDPGEWKIAARRALRTKQRIDPPQRRPVDLEGVAELTIYTHDITASVQFYKEIVGLPVGLAYFAHVHLAAENVAVVLRTTRWQCKAREQPHGSEPIFAVRDLDALRARLLQAGYDPSDEDGGMVVRDPVGIPLHFRSKSQEAPSLDI